MSKSMQACFPGSKRGGHELRSLKKYTTNPLHIRQDVHLNSIMVLPYQSLALTSAIKYFPLHLTWASKPFVVFKRLWNTITRWSIKVWYMISWLLNNQESPLYEIQCMNLQWQTFTNEQLKHKWMVVLNIGIQEPYWYN